MSTTIVIRQENMPDSGGLIRGNGPRRHLPPGKSGGVDHLQVGGDGYRAVGVGIGLVRGTRDPAGVRQTGESRQTRGLICASSSEAEGGDEIAVHPAAGEAIDEDRLHRIQLPSIPQGEENIEGRHHAGLERLGEG